MPGTTATAFNWVITTALLLGGFTALATGVGSGLFIAGLIQGELSYTLGGLGCLAVGTTVMTAVLLRSRPHRA